MRVPGSICGVICLALSTAAAAQTMDVPKAFQVFDRFCRPALISLDAFKAVASVPGPAGEKVYAVSPDGHFIAAQTSVDDFIVLAEFRYGAGFVARNCLVQQLTAQPADHAGIEAAFHAARWSGPTVTMTGGEVMEEIPSVGAMRLGGVGNITRPRGGYMIHGATEPAGSIVYATTGENLFTLSGFAQVAR